ncbi:uncharacterized protein LOC100181539 [Ciona intestinalis]
MADTKETNTLEAEEKGSLESGPVSYCDDSDDQCSCIDEEGGYDCVDGIINQFQKIRCRVELKLPRAESPSYVLTGKRTVKVAKVQSHLYEWKMVSPREIVYIFGIEIGPDTYKYATCLGEGKKLKFLESDVNLADIDNDENSTIKDPRAFFLETDSSADKCWLIPAMDQSLVVTRGPHNVAYTFPRDAEKDQHWEIIDM